MMSEKELIKTIKEEESYVPTDRTDQTYHYGILSTLRLVLNTK